MSSAGGRPSRQKMVSVGTSIVPPGPCPPPADTPGTSTAVTTPQVTASLHDFAVSLLGKCPRFLVIFRSWKLTDSIVILSCRVSQGCGLRRPVVDGVVDGTLVA
jgi:hypothetical protein